MGARRDKVLSRSRLLMIHELSAMVLFLPLLKEKFASGRRLDGMREQTWVANTKRLGLEDWTMGIKQTVLEDDEGRF